MREDFLPFVDIGVICIDVYIRRDLSGVCRSGGTAPHAIFSVVAGYDLSLTGVDGSSSRWFDRISGFFFLT